MQYPPPRSLSLPVYGCGTFWGRSCRPALVTHDAVARNCLVTGSFLEQHNTQDRCPYVQNLRVPTDTATAMLQNLHSPRYRRDGA